MVSAFLLSATLALGQQGAPEAPPPPAPDRWLLMKTLQGTWPGACLEAERMQRVLASL